MLGGIVTSHSNMKNKVQRRLIILVTAIALMGLVICFLTVKSQWQSGAVREKLKQLGLHPDSSGANSESDG